MNAINELKKEKGKADREVRQELLSAAAAVVATAWAYSRIAPSGFSFDAYPALRRKVDARLSLLKTGLLALIVGRAVRVSAISARKNQERYGVSRTLSEEEAAGMLDEEIEGETARERTGRYVGQLRDDLEAAVAAGLLAGLSIAGIYQLFVTRMGRPARSTGLGRGNYASALSSMTRLDYDMVQRAYIRNELLTFALMRRVVGFRVYRNSRIPCQLCDAVAGRIFPLASMVLPVHPRCICGAEPVTASGREAEKEA